MMTPNQLIIVETSRYTKYTTKSTPITFKATERKFIICVCFWAATIEFI